MRTNNTATATKPATQSTRPVIIKAEGALAEKLRTEGKRLGMTPAAFGRMLVNAGEICTAPGERILQVNQTATIAIPAKIARIIKKRGIEPEAFIIEMNRGIFKTDDFGEIVDVLHPLRGRPGYIAGLFLAEGRP